MSLPTQLRQFSGLIDLVAAQIVDEIKAGARDPSSAENVPVEMTGDTNRSEYKKRNSSTSAGAVAIVRQPKADGLARRGGNYVRTATAAG